MKTKDLNKSTICAQPWFGITIKPDGVAGICCEVTEELTDMNIRTHSFAEMQSHPIVTRIKDEMLAGKKPKECWRCWQKEAHGAPSLRHTLNNRYAEYNPTSEEFDPELIIPQNLEIVLGNLCQLRCVMCHPSRSRKVENTFKYIMIKDMRDSYEGLVSTLPPEFDTSWVEDEQLWESIADQGKEARRIYLNGGEPLLAKHHEKVLEKLIASGKAKDTELIYSTNGFLLEDEHMALWQEFKQVNIALSIDDLDDRNHFIRNPSNWVKLMESVDKVVEWQKDPKNKEIYIGIWCAINMLSFAYLPDYLEFFATKYPSIVIKGWRAIQTPEYLNPGNLPLEFKEQVAKEIKNKIAQYPQFAHLRSDIDHIVNSPSNEKLLDDGIAFMKMNAECYKVDLNTTFDRMGKFL